MVEAFLSHPISVHCIGQKGPDVFSYCLDRRRLMESGQMPSYILDRHRLVLSGQTPADIVCRRRVIDGWNSQPCATLYVQVAWDPVRTRQSLLPKPAMCFCTTRTRQSLSGLFLQRATNAAVAGNHFHTFSCRERQSLQFVTTSGSPCALRTVHQYPIVHMCTSGRPCALCTNIP